ncbi:hypothetical protein Hypma_006509 [Hypsizygus marmoreus]|uniref:GATA-type domain-containing protein n=1 Tax=Hypsizygus marmoreus TaxID=39966 RepID=A0A369K1C3_HYPMA|nr:hypothetical protein Hypma_006509 [Hypsizygus marmoreus]
MSKSMSSLPHDAASQNGRLRMPSSSYPAYNHSSSYSPDHSPVTLPKVGQTRCYWALLSSELQFIYLDPVLQSHLEEQAELLVGKSLLSFVHPDEQESAKVDLGGVLESRTLHGSVTRVRFSRLSKVRRQLGYEGPPAPWSEADKIALDSNYMAVDITINWAAEGLVLCFIHAIVDLTPNDNDEREKTDWTNWCGTPVMDPEQISLLYHRLLVCVQRPGTMNRVFQILANREGRPLLLTWPPEQGQGQGPSARDFARLVEGAKIDDGTPGTDAKTSCTRRYRSLLPVPSVMGEVESIFIPHGSVIFACHKVISSPRSSPNSAATMQQLGYSGPNYNPHQQSPYYEQGAPYALPPLSSSYSTGYHPQTAAYAPQRWSQGGEPPGSYNQWGSPSPAHSASPLPPAVSNLRSGSYPPPPQPSHQWQASSTSYAEPGAGFNRPISPGYNYSPTAGNTEGASPSSDVVPPTRRRVSPGSAREQPYPTSGRNAGNRPTGVLKCSSCKATSSPEWRKGPSGKKELCNACGLRFARSRAKKEGHNQTQRRRKDKGITKRESATPPKSGSPSYSAMRRSYGDSSFSSTGSNSGSEIYQHPGHHVLDDKMTPSPSPPASGMNFVHYSPNDGPSRPSSYPSATGPFYSVPSPLSNPPVQLEPTAPPPHGNTQLPPLGQISSYADRIAPMHSSGSPISHSPLTTMPPASFERERDRDRELPPAPLSVEPRHARRSILTQQ